MILLQHVKKSFSNHLALHDVSCKIESGEFIFLTGASGAGKSTLLRLLFLDTRPDQDHGGQVRISFGAQIAYDSKETPDSQLPLLRRQIGVIFQDYRLLPERDVFENIAFPLHIQGISESQIQESVWKAMSLTGIHSKRHEFPRSLSGGEQQRVAIARAIVSSPRLLIADEPTGNLDPQNTQMIFDILKKIHSQGTTVIMSTHDASLYSSHYGRRIKMESGKIINREWI
jgi:cell division transport system ATP-binding protein